MKIAWLFLLTGLPRMVWGWVKMPIEKSMGIRTLHHKYDEKETPPIPPPPLSPKGTLIEKQLELFRMARLKSNGVALGLLCITSGFISEPTLWTIWIRSPPFLAATAMVYMLTSASMMINDIYDYPVDVINNPERPLVKGTVTRREASVAVIILLASYTYFGIQFLPPILDPIWNIAMVLVTIYTPVLKRILIIKNVTCATVVAMSVWFMGISVMNPLRTEWINTHRLIMASEMVFTSSLYIEMLLDILDEKGDRDAGIATLPVMIGKDITILVLLGIIVGSECMVISNSLNMTERLIILITYYPFYKRISLILMSEYDRDVIHKGVKGVTVQLLIYLVGTIIQEKMK